MNGERAILFATDPPYLVDYDGSNHPTSNKDWSASYGTTWDDSSHGAELYDGFIAAAVAEAIDGRPWRGAVDIVTAGYPRQPFSVAGERRRPDDPRHL